MLSWLRAPLTDSVRVAFPIASRRFSSVARTERAPLVWSTIRIKGGKARQNDATRALSLRSH